MKAWGGVGEAYAASYAALCAGTFDVLVAALGPAEGRSLLDVVANFVLNHVSSPRTAARELGRIARVQVAATTWTRSPSWFWTEVVERAGLRPSAGERLPAEEDFDRTADGFAAMLVEAGLPEVAVSEHTWTWRADPDALWVSVEGGVAGAGTQYAGLSSAERSRFRAVRGDRRGASGGCGAPAGAPRGGRGLAPGLTGPHP